MIFLAIDTVFEQCSLALLQVLSKPDAKIDIQLLYLDTEHGKREQTQRVLPMLDAALRQVGKSVSELDVLVFNRGPGAFSGIRINTAVAQALSVAHDTPCVGVSSLQAIAQLGYEQYGITHSHAVMDARMNQVYTGEYQLHDDIMQPVTADTERLLDYHAMTRQAHPLLGDGATLLEPHPQQQQYGEMRPDAAVIGRLGVAIHKQHGGVDAEQALPVYLRHKAWKTLKEQGKA